MTANESLAVPPNTATLSAPMTSEMIFDPEDIQDIVTFMHMPEDVVLGRLLDYHASEMGNSWRELDPKTPQQMRAFYSSTELYIWELIQWHSSPPSESRWMAAKRVMEALPPSSHPRVLDYGCGVGTIALRYAQAGYQVTIADVPGRTLDFAKHRFARRGLPFQVYEVTHDLPALDETYDILVCMDVLEHLPNPDKTIFALAKQLRRGGMAVVLAAWGRTSDYPHHLEENCRRFGDTGNWWVVMNAAGLSEIEPMVYLKAGGWRLLVRRARYYVWKRTGFFLMRIPRYPGEGTSTLQTAGQTKC